MKEAQCGHSLPFSSDCKTCDRRIMDRIKRRAPRTWFRIAIGFETPWHAKQARVRARREREQADVR